MPQVNSQGNFSIDQVDQPWQVTGLLYLSELLTGKYKRGRLITRPNVLTYDINVMIIIHKSHITE